MNRIRVAFLGAAALLTCSALPKPALAMESNADASAQIAALKADIEQLRGQLPSQSHAMTDVDYQFTNLWFAAQERNWPLATFYLNETRSHIDWTVRLRPGAQAGVRAGPGPAPAAAGHRAIRTRLKSARRWTSTTARPSRSAYQDTLKECYSCHLSAEKPFLRPGIPASPASHLIQMKPGS